MIDAWVALLIYAALIAVAVWYINTHSERKPLYKRKRRYTGSVKKTPAYEPDDGPLTARQLKAIKKRVPQGRGKSVRSSLFG